MQLFQPLNIYREIRDLVLHWPVVSWVSLPVLGVMSEPCLQGNFDSNPNGKTPFAICVSFKFFWTQCFLQVVVTGDQWKRFLCLWFCSRALSNPHHQILIHTNQRPWAVIDTPMSCIKQQFEVVLPAATWKMDILCSLKKQLQVRRICQGKGVEKSPSERCSREVLEQDHV